MHADSVVRADCQVRDARPDALLRLELPHANQDRICGVVLGAARCRSDPAGQGREILDLHDPVPRGGIGIVGVPPQLGEQPICGLHRIHAPHRAVVPPGQRQGMPPRHDNQRLL
jgi:hypothetical protein